jgi:hypothetical protein
MIRSTVAVLLAASALSSAPSSAQDTTVFFEDFEAGLPASWPTASSSAVSWRALSNGECGAVTRMAAATRAASCDYVSGSAGTAILTLPDLQLPITDAIAAQFSFDYVLDIDAAGDHVALRLANPASPGYVFASEAQLVNDGALHTAVLSLDFASPGLNLIWFELQHDASGNLGRGLLVDNVRVAVPSPASAFCGESAGTPCPCASTAQPPYRGCPSSLGAGVTLRGVGSPHYSTDTYQLGAEDIPAGAPVLFFEGNAQANIPFGDGRVCAGGAIVRLGMRVATGGAAVYPGSGGVPISVRSPQSTPATRYYQVFFRDAAGPCGTGFNYSNGWSVTWAP